MATVITTPVGSAGLSIANDQIQPIVATVDGTSGNATSAAYTVPAGKCLIVKTADTNNQDTGTARVTLLEALDPSGNIVARLAGDGTTAVASTIVVRYSGHLLLFPACVLRTNNVAIGAFVPILKFTGILFNNGLPSSVLGIQ
jgi:hypothetical protein